MHKEEPPSTTTNTTSNSHKEQYVPARELPFELREHCVIYFEESLYSQAISLLNGLLVSTCNDSPGRDGFAYIPPAQQLALAATIVVHPSMTTRASSVDNIKASNSALRYLSTLTKVVGPVNANICRALDFVHGDRTSRRSANSRGQRTAAAAAAGDGGRGGQDEDDPTYGEINTEIATTGSLWHRAEDFWHAVGWAFNCSVVHKPRWERWRLWLGLMLDMLERDWTSRETEESLELEHCLIGKFIRPEWSRYGGVRRIIKALFADGSDSALREFKEVFPNETKERRSKNQTQIQGVAKRQKREEKVNVEEGKYGDYFDEEDEQDEQDDQGLDVEMDRKPSSVTASSWDDTGDGLSRLGGEDAFDLRIRLILLLSKVSLRFEREFTPVDSLYDVLAENVRVLPFPTFSLFLSPSWFVRSRDDSVFAVEYMFLATLVRILLMNMVAYQGGNETFQIDPDSSTMNIRIQGLAQYYLAFIASTAHAADQLKTSVLLETAMRLILKSKGTPDDLPETSSLQKSVQSGIDERRRAINSASKSRKRERNEGTLETILESFELSSERLLAVSKILGKS